MYPPRAACSEEKVGTVDLGTMADSGQRQAFDTGAVRDTAEGKPRMSLVTPFAIERLGRWYTLGADKYSRSVAADTNSVLDSLLEELVRCKRVQSATGKFMLEGCVEATTSETSECLIPSMPSGSGKTRDSGMRPIPSGSRQPPSNVSVTPRNESETKLLSVGRVLDALGLPRTSSTLCYGNRVVDAQSVLDDLIPSELPTLIMTMTRDSREESYAVVATTALGCLKSLVHVLKPLFDTWRIPRLMELPDGRIELFLSGDRNWERGMPISRYLDSLERHVLKFKKGDTSEDHLAAIMWNAAALIHTQEMIARGRLPSELNDMPDYSPAITTAVTQQGE